MFPFSEKQDLPNDDDTENNPSNNFGWPATKTVLSNLIIVS